MALTDREAADLRKEDAVSKAYRTLSHHKQTNRNSPAMAFRNGLIEAVRELRKDLIDIYSELDSAGEEPLRGELVRVIGDRVSACIRSSVAGIRGTDAPLAARTGARLVSSATMGVARDLDLAVHALSKKKAPGAPLNSTVPTRKKQ